jgi:uncharacterized protein (UPF0335 family)
MCEEEKEEMGGITADAEKIFADLQKKGYSPCEIESIIAIASIELTALQLFN